MPSTAQNAVMKKSSGVKSTPLSFPLPQRHPLARLMMRTTSPNLSFQIVGRHSQSSAIQIKFQQSSAQALSGSKMRSPQLPTSTPIRRMCNSSGGQRAPHVFYPFLSKTPPPCLRLSSTKMTQWSLSKSRANSYTITPQINRTPC